MIPLRSTLDKMGILWCLFVPKISKIGQEIAELGAFPPERLRESIEKHIIASYIIASYMIVSCIIASYIIASNIVANHFSKG